MKRKPSFILSSVLFNTLQAFSLRARQKLDLGLTARERFNNNTPDHNQYKPGAVSFIIALKH